MRRNKIELNEHNITHSEEVSPKSIVYKIILYPKLYNTWFSIYSVDFVTVKLPEKRRKQKVKVSFSLLCGKFKVVDALVFSSFDAVGGGGGGWC